MVKYVNLYKISRLFISTGLRWLWITIVVFIIDLYTKYLLLENLTLGDIIPILPVLNIYYISNYGAAFSFLSNNESWQYWLFVSIAAFVCLLLLVLMYYEKAAKKMTNIAYALIIGGAIGNLFNRLWCGFVIDMIDFYIGNWHFATFNFADSAICIGVILIVLKELLVKSRTKM